MLKSEGQYINGAFIAPFISRSPSPGPIEVKDEPTVSCYGSFQHLLTGFENLQTSSLIKTTYIFHVHR